MDMGSTALVMTGHEGVESGDTIFISKLKTTESGALQHASIVGVTHSGVALDTDIGTLSCVEMLVLMEIYLTVVELIHNIQWNSSSKCRDTPWELARKYRHQRLEWQGSS
jgi:hypothetical protein